MVYLIFKPKILLCVNIGGPWIGKGWLIPWIFRIYLLWPFGNLVAIYYIFSTRFGILCQEKSGNPEFWEDEAHEYLRLFAIGRAVIWPIARTYLYECK
jgi:hypothetical protein